MEEKKTEEGDEENPPLSRKDTPMVNNEEEKTVEEEEKEDGSPVKKAAPGTLDLLEKLFLFLDTPENEQVNPVLAGYFSKLINIFINKKPKNIYSYMYSNPTLLEKMVRHTYSKSISEVLVKFLTYEEQEGELADLDVPAQKNRLLTLLIDKLGPNETEEDNLNAQDILVELTDTKPLLEHLMTRDNLLKTIGFLQSNKQSSQIAALQLLNAIAGHCKGLLAKKPDEEGKEGEQEEDRSAKSMVALLSNQLEFVVKLLDGQAPVPENDTATYGYAIKPFGLLRLRVVEFLNSVVLLQSNELLEVLKKNNVFATLLQFLQDYPWNNMLHMKINTIFEEILKNQEARVSIVKNSGILEKLIEMGDEPEFKFPSDRPQRHGYMSFVISLSNIICKTDDLKEVCEETPAWEKYKNEQLF